MSRRDPFHRASLRSPRSNDERGSRWRVDLEEDHDDEETRVGRSSLPAPADLDDSVTIFAAAPSRRRALENEPHASIAEEARFHDEGPKPRAHEVRPLPVPAAHRLSITPFRPIALPPMTTLRSREWAAPQAPSYAATPAMDSVQPMAPWSHSAGVPPMTMRPAMTSTHPQDSSVAPWSVAAASSRHSLPAPKRRSSPSSLMATALGFFAAALVVASVVSARSGDPSATRTAGVATPHIVDLHPPSEVVTVPPASVSPPTMMNTTVAMSPPAVAVPVKPLPLAASTAPIAAAPAAPAVAPSQSGALNAPGATPPHPTAVRAPTPAAKSAPHIATPVRAPSKKSERPKSVEEMLKQLGDEQLRR